MGTRADFYVGRGKDARWLGSIAFDGYPDDGDIEAVARATTAEEFEAAVAKLAERDDFTKPADGWPWPWDDSRTTDYAYAFDDGVWVSRFGKRYTRFAEYVALDADARDELPRGEVFPRYGGVEQAVTLGRRSGVLILGRG